VSATTRLQWPHKGQIPLLGADGYHLNDPSHIDATAVHTVIERDHVGDPTEENLLVVGEARDALRAVTADPVWGPRCAGARLAYLDPPFNTGRNFANYTDALPEDLWLSLFQTRLETVLPLLAPDASIWIHLDEAQVHHARCILDELLGADAYLRTVVWQRKNKPGPSRSVAAVCDHLLVYGRTAGVSLRRLPPTVAQLGRYTNPDADPSGPWIRRHDGGRRYLDEFTTAGAVPTSLWLREDAGDNEEATRELVALFGAKTFATPKPERLLERVITIASDEGDRVIDCFAGSGTTAAVALKMRRRFLTVELSSSTVTDIVEPRLRAVVEGRDNGGISQARGWGGGSGFTLAGLTPAGLTATDGR
jgi:adenine-specific DNA-methyltransferase